MYCASELFGCWGFGALACSVYESRLYAVQGLGFRAFHAFNANTLVSGFQVRECRDWVSRSGCSETCQSMVKEVGVRV